MWAALAVAQIPGLPGASESSTPKTPAAPTTPPATTEPISGASVAPPVGPISVQEPIQDAALRDLLSRSFGKYPGVREIRVEVEHGVVTLEGHVVSEESRAALTQFTQKVEGVRLVINRMKTDAQVLTAWQRAATELESVWQIVAQNWLLAMLALAYVLIFLLLARLFASHAEFLLAPFFQNVMLRSVLGSVISAALMASGALLALSVLNLTHIVLSVVGLAGVAGLALGFAFRDIAENFIASILLGARRPFRIGDYIQVAGKEGVVKTLNTRATVLVTADGNHVRIPNNIIYKEILVNSTASSSSRGTFDLMISYEASTVLALETITRTLQEHEGVLSDPPPRALVEDLKTNGVQLRVYFWMPAQGIDGMKLLSDLRMKVKVALQQVGIAPPPKGVVVSLLGRLPVDVFQSDGQRPQAEAVLRPSAAITAAQAEANLQLDQQAAESLTAAPIESQETAAEQVVSDEESRVSEEGTNLIAEPAPEASSPEASNAAAPQSSGVA